MQTANLDLEVSSMALPDPTLLREMGEYFVAGYFEQPEAGVMARWSRGTRRRLEWSTPPEHAGGALHPSGTLSPEGLGENQLVQPNYSYTWGCDWTALAERIAQAAETEAATLEAMEEIALDVASGSWRTDLPKLDLARSPRCPQVTAKGGNVWVLGGRDVPRGTESFVYHPDRNVWSAGAAPPLPAAWGAAGEAGGRLIVVAGAAVRPPTRSNFFFSNRTFLARP